MINKIKNKKIAVHLDGYYTKELINLKKANGEGSITFDSVAKKYLARITDTAGKRISKRFKTKAEADIWLSQIKADISRESYVPQSDITVMEWVAEYLDTYKYGKVRVRTFTTYIHTAKHIRHIGDIKLQDLSAHTVQKLYQTLSKKVGWSVNTKVHQLLKASITKAVLVGLLRKNIMDAVEAPKKDYIEVVVFDDQELGKLNTFFKESQYYKNIHDIYTIALYTGMRLGEILGLKEKAIHTTYLQVCNNIQQINGNVYDELPKTKSSFRKIPLNKTLMELLGKYANSQSEAYIFHTASGGPIAPTNFENSWKKACKGAGIDYKRFHAIRHTFATRMLLKFPVANVSKILGHSNPDITYRYYVHSLPELEQQMVDVSEDLFNF